MLFELDEVHAAYLHSGKPLPDNAPPLNEVIRLIAGVGGFLAGKNDGEPGEKTLWIGLQCLVDFIAGMRAVRNIFV